MKKIIIILISAVALFLFSTHAFAFSVSVGMPMNQKFVDSESKSMSGYLIGVQLPFAVGLGVDSYKTKVKDMEYLELETNMYNIFYQLPIPVVNLIFGLGAGNHQFKCSDVFDGAHSPAISCEDYFKKGSVTQWYTSIGIPIIPFFDIHLSYRSINSKKVEMTSKAGDEAGSKSDLNSTVTGLGIAFNF